MFYKVKMHETCAPRVRTVNLPLLVAASSSSASQLFVVCFPQKSILYLAGCSSCLSSDSEVPPATLRKVFGKMFSLQLQVAHKSKLQSTLQVQQLQMATHFWHFATLLPTTVWKSRSNGEGEGEGEGNSSCSTLLLSRFACNFGDFQATGQPAHISSTPTWLMVLKSGS